ncbi:hypothetical protein [Halocatena marina]|uniref:Uncharacterized protein n=1 Tax=Halocatena marina TaxID=2934937 RepID=A0ABD5YR77_9EURY|nr:hypothetical protein [Halocatena marina]
MRGDTTVRIGAALILIAYCALIAALYDPLSIPIDFEVALPIALIVGVGLIAVWYRFQATPVL